MVIDHSPHIRSDAGISNADLVLGELATAIHDKVADDHLIARFADDVFTLLVEGNDRPAAEGLAETIRTAAENHMFEASGKNYQVTLSIGLSMIAENTPTVEQAISRANQASDSIEEGTPLLSMNRKILSLEKKATQYLQTR